MTEKLVRPIGRAKVSEDSALGLRTLTRKYATTGLACEKLDDPLNPLFLNVGTPDEEHPDYAFVSQQLEPGHSVDQAYVVRRYVRLRASCYSENSSQSRDVVRLQRTYIALRQNERNLTGVHASRGYSHDAWGLHPASNPESYSEPWEYLPKIVEADRTKLDRQENSPWLLGPCSVDTSNAGFDLWRVSWVKGSEGYDAVSADATGSQSMVEVSFGEDGLDVKPLRTTQNGSTSFIRNRVSFVKSRALPDVFTEGTNGIPYVMVDLTVQLYKGGAFRINRTFKNAVFRVDPTSGVPLAVKFTALRGAHAGTGITVGVGTIESLGGKLTFDYQEHPQIVTQAMAANDPRNIVWDQLLKFQGQAITGITGKITYTHRYKPSDAAGGVVLKTTAQPIHSHQGEHIWKLTRATLV